MKDKTKLIIHKSKLLQTTHNNQCIVNNITGEVIGWHPISMRIPLQIPREAIIMKE